MKEITERQKDVLFFISDFIEKNSYPPTVREISSSFGISVRAVQDHLGALEKKGYITHVPGCSRSFKILKREHRNTEEEISMQVGLILTFMRPCDKQKQKEGV